MACTKTTAYVRSKPHLGEIENTKKKFCAIFKNRGLKITTEANKKVIDHLDITLNLNDGSYSLYSKPNNNIVYINKQSNHPPNITANIPKGINKRLSTISSSLQIFNNSTVPYQQALTMRGYTHQLQYNLDTPPTNNQHRKQEKTKEKCDIV